MVKNPTKNFTQRRYNNGGVYQPLIYTYKDPSLENHPILNCIYDNLYRQSTLTDLLKAYDIDFDLNLIIKVGTLTNNNTTASTGYNSNNRTATITINQNRIDGRTDIELARTILHEAAHAYILAARAKNGDNSLANAGFPEIFAAYMGDIYDKYCSTTTNVDECKHHNIMINYIDRIARGLHEFDYAKNYAWEDYRALAWQVLDKTVAYFNKSPDAKTRIDNQTNEVSLKSPINCK